MIVAIDPGKSGGVAWKNRDGEIRSESLPHTIHDLVALLRSIKLEGCSTAYLEKVGGYIQGSPAGSSRGFVFGKSVGQVEGVLASFGFRIEEVLPRTWQKPLGIGTRSSSESPAAWKRKLRDACQRRFPSIDVTLKTADALLILDYALSERK